MYFLTHSGSRVPAVTAEQMRQVDRVAMEVFRLGLLEMMENAGRALASVVLKLQEVASGPVLILAGKGGNGGGGLCAARHLLNHGVPVGILLADPQKRPHEATELQLQVLRASGAVPAMRDTALLFDEAAVVVDALIGYGLSGVPRNGVARLIERANAFRGPVVSLDVPSGIDATTGDAPGAAVAPTHTVTLALPKTGLWNLSGRLLLADIGIPPAVFERIGVPFRWPERATWVVELVRASSQQDRSKKPL